MTAEEVLRSNEEEAVDNNQIVSSVVGKGGKKKGLKVKKGFGAAIFITIMIVLFLIFFSAGNLIPSAISERLVEETDVQYADSVDMKIEIFKKALSNGTVPSNTAERLKNAGVEVEGNSLKMDGKTISASEFPSAVKSNVKLYDAFTSATYNRAAYYFDDSADTVFKQIGSSRNNYKSSDKSFEEIMTDAVGSGNGINGGNTEDQVWEVPAVSDDELNIPEDKKDTITEGEIADLRYQKYLEHLEAKKAECRAVGEVGDMIDEWHFICWVTKSDGVTDAGAYISFIGEENSNLETASVLSAADAVATEQKSSLYYLTLMENISKMKAGEGSNTRINDAMNYLYKDEESEVVDVNTGEVVTKKGSMLESPSLYAILADEKVDPSDVENYSTERVLKTIENQNGSSETGKKILESTYTSTTSKIRSTIARYKFKFSLFGGTSADDSVTQTVQHTLNSSLVDNSFDSIKGIRGGELLVQGAVNVGASLATMSGSSIGSSEAVKEYARETDTFLALDAEVDRMHRSPLDITSKNTFLGSIVYKFAVSSIKSGTLLNKLASISKVTSNSIMSLLPTTNADDENINFMTNSGNCERFENIGAVGTVGCSRNETFDLSTMDIDDSEFLAAVAENVDCNGDMTDCTIKKGSDFEKYVYYNVGRESIIGNVDGSILDAQKNNGQSKPTFINKVSTLIRKIIDSIKDFISHILDRIFHNEKYQIASGEAFVNSSDNKYWNKYKYAQRYLSYVRAVDAMRKYDGDETAYADMPYVGKNNPVLACLEEFRNEILAYMDEHLDEYLDELEEE